MKLFNLLLIFLFLAAAALQYNDPDPYVWMPLYLSGAVACWLSLKNKFYPALYIVLLLVYIAYAVYLFAAPSGVWSWLQEHHSESLVQSMKATKPWIEQTREFGGLLILSVAVLVNYIVLKRKQKALHTPNRYNAATAKGI